jgi:hypothetical protein
MGTRLLIVAGEAAGGADQLPAGVRLLIDRAEAILVVAPRLPGRLEWIASDTDRATRRADERLEAVLGHLDDLGAPAHGQIGSDDVLEVFGDAIREFAPDHLLIGLRPLHHAGWQERGLLERIVALYRLPLTVFEIPG